MRRVDLATLIKSLERLKIDGIREIEERFDPQYKSLLKLKDRGDFSMVTVGNSLVCYQLSSTGEEYWEEFSQYFTNHPLTVSQLRKFITTSKGNKRFLFHKLRRLDIFSKFSRKIKHNLSMNTIWNLLVDNGFGRKQKTTVFAVKMFGYAKRIITGKFEPYPMDIPIPVDSRISRMTAQFTSENPQSFWQKIGEQTGIPPLHIDSLLWNWERVKDKLKV